MKKILINIILLLFIFSCEKDLSPINVDDVNINLSPGNKYRFFVKHYSNEYDFTREIIKDTLINNKQYYLTDSDRYDMYRLLRFESGILYSRYYELGVFVDRIIFDFNSQVGDTVVYNLIREGIVKSTNTSKIFGEPQKKYVIVPFNSTSKDSIVFVSKFILLSRYYESGELSEILKGVRTNGKNFGEIN